MRTLLGTLVTLALLAVPAPAQADRWSGDDPLGDTSSYRWDPADPCSATEVVSDAAGGEDITGLGVRHRPRKVVLALEHAEPASTSRRTVEFHVRTPRRDLVVEVVDRRGRWWLTVGVEPDWSPTDLDWDGDGVSDCTGWFGASSFWRCRNREITETALTLSVVVPRECLRNPAWVEVGAEGWGDAPDDVSIHDEWGTAEPSVDPRVVTYGERVAVRVPQKGSPSNRSRVTKSETSTRRSFVTSRTGLPIGRTAATAY